MDYTGYVTPWNEGLMALPFFPCIHTLLFTPLSYPPLSSMLRLSSCDHSVVSSLCRAVVQDNLNPVWKPTRLSVQAICNGKPALSFCMYLCNPIDF